MHQLSEAGYNRLNDLLREVFGKQIEDFDKPIDVIGGMSILFHEELKDSDDVEVMASRGDFGMVIEACGEGYKVKNISNDKEFVVLISEFKIIHRV